MKTAATRFFIAMAVVFAVKATAAQDLPDRFVLKVGYFDFPGLTYVDKNGTPAGLVNEITTKTLDNAKIAYTMESYPAARLYDYLAKGKIHLFNGLGSIPLVKESAISGKETLFPLEMRIYHREDREPVIRKEQLAGRSVILIRGFTYKDWGGWIRNKGNRVKYYETNTHEAAFRMLRRNRADYLLNYKYIGEDCLKKFPIPNLVIKPLFRWQCSFNISRSTPHAETLLKRLEQSYYDLIARGELIRYD
ncbi:MAG: transporter substrate-binding domain-containing protein [Desulfobacteraceae bacterium]|nr:transporter substrate-binding domain-containing protein [Desulfobacteraceae bacterium]